MLSSAQNTVLLVLGIAENAMKEEDMMEEEQEQGGINTVF